MMREFTNLGDCGALIKVLLFKVYMCLKKIESAQRLVSTWETSVFFLIN